MFNNDIYNIIFIPHTSTTRSERLEKICPIFIQ